MGKTGNTEQDERGLLPYPVIIAATKGGPGSYGDCRQALRKPHHMERATPFLGRNSVKCCVILEFTVKK